MKALFDTDFKIHYGITSRGAIAVEHIVKNRSFDLDDKSTPPVVSVGKGQLSVNTTEDVDILEYEKFINQCKVPGSFSNGRRRCDYRLRHPLMRFLGIESQEVGNDGAIISCPSIEAMGFEYRRISHKFAFKL